MTATANAIAYERGRRDGLVAATNALADTIRTPHARIVVERSPRPVAVFRATAHTPDGTYTHDAMTRLAAIGAAVASLPCSHIVTLEEAP